MLQQLHLVRHTFSLENVTILADLDDRLPVIYGAPEKLKQVWMNLLHNASGAMPGGGLIKVRTRLDIVNMTVTAWFADTGIGIPEPNLQQIFDPFFSTKPVGKGTGLGLSVSFGIIEDHEGFIEAHSPLPPGFIDEDMPQGAVRGPGSVFRVVLAPPTCPTSTPGRRCSRKTRQKMRKNEPGRGPFDALRSSSIRLALRARLTAGAPLQTFYLWGCSLQRELSGGAGGMAPCPPEA